MKYKQARFSDAAAGTITVDGNKNKYFKTKDSDSSSGHSLIAQIDMTHAGIVTRNYGFYLPAKMRGGAPTFTKDFYKPVLIGHDELIDTTPIGRVVEADYVDTTGEYMMRDNYLQRLSGFADKEDKKDAVVTFVNYIISNYDKKDNYKGLGHIRGSLKITDEKAIAAILDERFLTVSTSMISDAARCSVCGTDWVKDGMCEHSRGQAYEDTVCVLIPGNMRYEHVGVVNSPADPHAHTFVIIDHQGAEITDNLNKDINRYEVKDAYEIAANLFAYKDSNLVSLSSKEDINLIQVKDNIQRMENAMNDKTKQSNDKLLQRIKDAMGVTVRIYRYDEEGKDDMEVSVSQYVKSLEEKSLQKLVSKTAALVEDSKEATDLVINDAIEKSTDELFKNIIDGKTEKEDADLTEAWEKLTKVEDTQEEDEAGHQENDEEGKGAKDEIITIASVFDSKEKLDDEKKQELALESISKVYKDTLNKNQAKALVKALIGKNEKDAVAELNYQTDTVNELVASYFTLQDAKSLGDMTVEEIYEAMAEVLKEKALDEEKQKELKSSDYCGVKGAFPVVDSEHYFAAKKVLAEVKAADSVKKRILDAIEKKAEKLGLDIKNFDTEGNSCNNDQVSNEELLKAFEDAKAKLIENDIEVPGIKVEDNTPSEEVEEKDQEISILEAQLDAANEELDENKELLDNYKTKLIENLAVKAVDKKIAQGFQIEDREIEIKELKERSLDSLSDLIKDLEKNEKVPDNKINDGVANDPAGSVDDPTLSNDDETVNKRKQQKNDKEEKRYKIYDQYQQKLTRYGKPIADRWLALVQRKNGLRPTID